MIRIVHFIDTLFQDGAETLVKDYARFLDKKKIRLCKFLSVKSIIHEKGSSMAYKQKVEFPLPIFGFATN